MADDLVVEEAVPADVPVAGSGPEVPPEAAGDPAMEQTPEEPYGAQLLRKLHEDAALLLMEYDQAMAPLDNPDVRAYLTEVMKLLDKQVLSAAEKCFKKQYKQLPPLVPDEAATAEEGAYQGEETPEEEAAEDVVQEEAEPADVPPDGDPPVEEDVIVEEEGKDYGDAVGADSAPRRDAPAGEAMRGMYKNGKSLNGRKAIDKRAMDSAIHAERQVNTDEPHGGEELDRGLMAQGANAEFDQLGIPAGHNDRYDTAEAIDSYAQGAYNDEGEGDNNARNQTNNYRDYPTRVEHNSTLKRRQEQIRKAQGKSLLHSISPLPGGKGFRVVETYGEKSRHVDLTVKGVNKYLSGFKGRGAKSLLSAVAKGLNAGKSVRFKSALPCPQCNNTPCTCAEKALPGQDGKAMPGTEKWQDMLVDAPNSTQNTDPSSPQPGGSNFGSQASWVELLDPHVQEMDEALGQLTDLADGEVTWDELQRAKAFHYHKMLEKAYLKCASGCGTKDMGSPEPGGAEDLGNLDPEAEKHLKALAMASGFLKALSGSKDFGDPHRREAKFHAGNVKELLKAMGAAPDPTPNDHAEATYAEPGEMGEKDLDAVAAEQEASAKALADLARGLTGKNL